MRLIKWNPMFNEEDEFFNFPMVRTNNAPSLDIYQDKDNIYAQVALPGVDPEKINISIENNVLTLESSVEKKSEMMKKIIIVKKFVMVLSIAVFNYQPK